MSAIKSLQKEIDSLEEVMDRAFADLAHWRKRAEAAEANVKELGSEITRLKAQFEAADSLYKALKLVLVCTRRYDLLDGTYYEAKKSLEVYEQAKQAASGREN